MKTTASPEIQNRLAELRRKRGLSAAALAETAGVSRQTIYAIEAGSFVPNTAVALRLAQALNAKVEDLFALAETSSVPDFPFAAALMLPGDCETNPGQPVQLCRVGKLLIASTPSPVPFYLPPSDAVVSGKSAQTQRAKVAIHSEVDYQNRVLIAGCDPGISVLARSALSAGVELVLAHRNSSQALALLQQGHVHIAGTHLRDEATGESNIPQIARMFPKRDVAVISFALWEEGIVTAQGNPKSIRGLEDFARPDIRIVNREGGAGSRLLLDSHLRRLQIDPGGINGYGHTAAGHLPAAWEVRMGTVDCCVATRVAARAFGLGFIPLVSERYDLAIRKQYLDLPAVEAVLDILNRLQFRRELEAVGGYETKVAGQRVV